MIIIRSLMFITSGISEEIRMIASPCFARLLMIMREGNIMGELSHDEYDQERILKYAMGVSNNE